MTCASYDTTRRYKGAEPPPTGSEPFDTRYDVWERDLSVGSGFRRSGYVVVLAPDLVLASDAKPSG